MNTRPRLVEVVHDGVDASLAIRRAAAEARHPPDPRVVRGIFPTPGGRRARHDDECERACEQKRAWPAQHARKGTTRLGRQATGRLAGRVSSHLTEKRPRQKRPPHPATGTTYPELTPVAAGQH